MQSVFSEPVTIALPLSYIPSPHQLLSPQPAAPISCKLTPGKSFTLRVEDMLGHEAAPVLFEGEQNLSLQIALIVWSQMVWVQILTLPPVAIAFELLLSCSMPLLLYL